MVLLVCCSCTSVVVEAPEPVYVSPGSPAVATFRLETAGLTALISEYPSPNPRERCFKPVLSTDSVVVGDNIDMLQCVRRSGALPQYLEMAFFEQPLPPFALVYLPNAAKSQVIASAGTDSAAVIASQDFVLAVSTSGRQLTRLESSEFSCELGRVVYAPVDCSPT